MNLSIDLDEDSKMIPFFYKRKEQIGAEGLEAILKNQPKLTARLKDDISHLSVALEEMNAKYRDENRYVEVFNFYNAITFFKLSFLDIAILFKSYITTQDELERQVYIKFLALNFYEFLSDLPTVFGKKMFDAIEKRNIEPLNTEIKKFRALCNELKSLCSEDLKNIRHQVAAHKDQNALKQLETLRNIESHKIEVLYHAGTILFLRLGIIEEHFFGQPS